MVGAKIAVVEVAGAVETLTTPTLTPTIIKEIRIRIQDLISLPETTSLTKRGPSIQISPPVLAGPVRSTGRKAGELLIVATPSSASGRTSWPHAPEPLASLASMYNPALKI